MSSSGDDRGGDASALEVVSARSFDASRERVWEAFSDPSRLARWWGPEGFANTFHEFDLRPGGRWRFVMHGPDGADYPSEIAFVEVVEPERIVLRRLSEGHRFELTITLAEQDGRTLATWRMRHATAEECARVKPFVVVANEQNFDRLAAELRGAAQAAPSRPR